MDEWSCNEVGARAQNGYIVEAIGGEATQYHNIYTWIERSLGCCRRRRCRRR